MTLTLEPVHFRGQRDIDLDIDIDDIGYYRYRYRYWVTIDIDIDIFSDTHVFLVGALSDIKLH